MEQRAKQLAALTLEDEEEVKKEVREVSEPLEIMLWYLKAPILLRKTYTENPWELCVLYVWTPVNISPWRRLGHRTSQQHCTGSVVSLKAAWCHWAGCCSEVKEMKNCVVCVLCNLLWSNWNLCESMLIVFHCAAGSPCKKKTTLCQEFFLKILQIAENFRLSLERSFCWEIFVYLRLWCLYRFSVSKHVLKRHRVIIQEFRWEGASGVQLIQPFLDIREMKREETME